MADPVYLFLKVNGVAVEGESSQTSSGRAHSIECRSYRQGVATRQDADRTGRTTDRRTYDPLVIRKWIDRSSPLLAKALTQNQHVDGVFKFFRPSARGDGTPEHYFTTEFRMGRIVRITQFVTDTGEPGDLPHRPFEEVEFVFSQIAWTDEIGRVTYEDVVKGAGNGLPDDWTASSAAADAPAASAGGSSSPAQIVATAPEPLRPLAVPRRPPSRVATIVPLTDVDGAG